MTDPTTCPPALGTIVVAVPSGGDAVDLAALPDVTVPSGGGGGD
jgi:hypothetical protein